VFFDWIRHSTGLNYASSKVALHGWPDLPLPSPPLPLPPPLPSPPRPCPRHCGAPGMEGSHYIFWEQIGNLKLLLGPVSVIGASESPPRRLSASSRRAAAAPFSWRRNSSSQHQTSLSPSSYIGINGIIEAPTGCHPSSRQLLVKLTVTFSLPPPVSGMQQPQNENGNFVKFFVSKYPPLCLGLGR
jgi:hypothetical protein